MDALNNPIVAIGPCGHGPTESSTQRRPRLAGTLWAVCLIVYVIASHAQAEVDLPALESRWSNVSAAQKAGDNSKAASLAKAGYQLAAQQIKRAQTMRDHAECRWFIYKFMSVSHAENDAHRFLATIDALIYRSALLLNRGDDDDVQATLAICESQLELAQKHASLQKAKFGGIAGIFYLHQTRTALASEHCLRLLRKQPVDKRPRPADTAQTDALLSDAVESLGQMIAVRDALPPANRPAIDAEVMYWSDRCLGEMELRRARVLAAARPEVRLSELGDRLTANQGRLKRWQLPSGFTIGLRRYLVQFGLELDRFDLVSVDLNRIRVASEAPDFPTYVRAEVEYLHGMQQAASLQLDRAASAFERVIALTAEPSNWPPKEAERRQFNGLRARTRLAMVADRRGDNRRAIELLEAAYQIAEQANLLSGIRAQTDTLDLVFQLGDCCRKANRIDDAKRYLAEGLKIAGGTRNDSDRPSAIVAMLLNSQALTLYAEGDLKQAESVLQSLVDRLPSETVIQAECRTNLAWIYFEQGRLDDSEQSLRLALSVFESAQGAAGLRTGECLSYLGRVALANGKRDDARNLLSRALQSRDTLLTRLARQALTERERLGVVQELRVHRESSRWPGVVDSYLELAPKLNIKPAEQYSWVLRWKGTAYRDSRSEFLRTGDYPGRTRRAILLEQLRTYTQASTFQALGSPTASPPSRSDEVSALESEINSIERQALASSNPASRDQHVQPPQVDELTAALPRDAAFLDILKVKSYRPVSTHDANIGEQFFYVGFLTLPAGTLRIEFGQAGDAGTIDAAVTEFTRALERGEDVSKAGRTVAELLRAPLAKHLVDTRYLVVSADGMLMRLPFAAIPTESGGYWLEELAFSVSSSADSYLQRHRRRTEQARKRGSGILLAGAIDYGLNKKSKDDRRGFRGTVQWPKLSETLQEVLEIRRIAASKQSPLAGTKPTLLIGKKATEEQFKQWLPKASYAHLATHGFFAEQSRRQQSFDVFDLRDQLDSAVVCAGANDDAEGAGEDQYLTALEIRDLDLSGLHHLTLSACQTGLGHINEGQGLVGLLGAFERAGTGTMVTSLWEVPSEATQRLMGLYYANLLSVTQPQVPAEAMRQAQLQLLKSEEFEHPVDWGAWIVSGDPFALPK